MLNPVVKNIRMFKNKPLADCCCFSFDDCELTINVDFMYDFSRVMFYFLHET